MDETVVLFVQNGVGWGLAVLVLVGVYRLIDRLISVHEEFLVELNESLKELTDVIDSTQTTQSKKSN